ncbi:hypothetical protein FRC07_001255 [Ceratobasidium sp. 392]|nr:hypothetical protein FRC07_001255 [Ceratobasidium sp. 392]
MNRRKKCDEARPICERCTRAGMECLGYDYLEEAGAKAKRPRAKLATRPPKPTPSIAGPSRQPTADPPSMSTISSLFQTPGPSFNRPPHQNTDPPTSSFWSLLPSQSQDNALANSTPSDVHDFSFLSDPSSTLLNSQDVFAGWWDTTTTLPSTSAQQVNQPTSLAPRAYSSDFSATSPFTSPESSSRGLGSYHSLGASSNAPTSMTPGQASLFRALFSLGSSSASSPFDGATSQTPSSSHGSTWPSPDVEENDNSSVTSEESDPEGIREIVCRSPTLDKNAPSNSLPFILQSYSTWMRWTVFEPLRMANKARNYLITRFNQSQDSRWTITMLANIVRSLERSSSSGRSYLPAISLLRDRTQRKLTLARSHDNPPNESNSRTELDALDDVFELISLQFMSSSIRSNMGLIREAAPVYLRAWPDSPGTPLNLPAILVHPEYSLRHFPALDILISLSMCRPMLLRYDVSYTQEICAAVTDIDTIGLQWMHGVPDQFIMLLARMNMLRVDFAPNVDPQIVDEIEAEIRDFRPVLGVSTDPFLTVARLGVQESWRQALYIYLYMGLCGADASDPRVEKALKGFIRLLEGTKPGRTPDSFLIVPMIVAGVASRRPQDRKIIQSRMLNLRECSQPDTAGHETVLTMSELWLRTDAEARPAVWMDLRIAAATITGV